MLAGNAVVVNDKDTHFMGAKFEVVLLCDSVVRLCQGNGYNEGGSLSFFAVHFDGTVHQLHDTLRNRHSEAGAAISACSGGVLLCKRIKQLREILLAHPDSRILDRKTQCRFFVHSGDIFNGEEYTAAFRRKLHGIAQDVDHHLAKLHIIADIVFVDLSLRAALIVQSFIPALAADHGVHLLQHLGERELLVPDCQTSGLNPAHIQDIVDNAEQVMRRGSDLFQMLPRLWGDRRIIERNIVQADDGIHRSTDLMAHIGQERSLGFIRRFRCSQGLMQSLVLLHGLACLQIHIHKAGSNRMDLMIPAVLRMAHAGESNLFPEISVMPTDQITIRDDTLLLKLGSDILRLNETKEFLQVLLANVLPGIGSHGSQIRESLSHLKAFFQVKLFSRSSWA